MIRIKLASVDERPIPDLWLGKEWVSNGIWAVRRSVLANLEQVRKWTLESRHSKTRIYDMTEAHEEMLNQPAMTHLRWLRERPVERKTQESRFVGGKTITYVAYPRCHVFERPVDAKLVYLNADVLENLCPVQGAEIVQESDPKTFCSNHAHPNGRTWVLMPIFPPDEE